MYASWGIPNYWRVTEEGVVTQAQQGIGYVPAEPTGWLGRVDLVVAQ